MADDTSIGGMRQRFPQTRWSVIEGTRSEHAGERQRALDVLVSAYWKPVYKYIRLHWNKQNEEAKDLTQDFFARLIEKNLLDRFDPAKARLRTYLRVCVDGLVMNTDKAAQRQKRGGDIAIFPWISNRRKASCGSCRSQPPAVPKNSLRRNSRAACSDWRSTASAANARKRERLSTSSCSNSTTSRKAASTYL